MKKCPNPKCKMSRIPDDALFCPKCGKRLSVSEAELSASRTTIRKYQMTTISWKSEEADKVRFEGRILACPGSKQVKPYGNHKYTVDFLDAKGKLIESRSITIEVTPNWKILLILIALWVIIGIIGAIVATNL